MRSGKDKGFCIGDLVEIPEIKTVIQLEDLKDPRLSRMILETFVLTGEVLDNLKAVLTGLCGGEGRGIFLKGHFGSGKSHFLGMLSLLLKSPGSWKALVSQSPDLADFERRLADFNFLVAEVSLVQHRASEFIEDIITGEITRILGAEPLFTDHDSHSRHDLFLRHREIILQRGYTGMVILVDEILRFFHEKTSLRGAGSDPNEIFQGFQRFQDAYSSLYIAAHSRERGMERFRHYEKLLHSRPYGILKRLDRLEMISVKHNRRSVEQDLSSVLVNRCTRSPGEDLPARPVCSCGFRLGETLSLKPVREIEREIDQGISETLEALKLPSIQEKICGRPWSGPGSGRPLSLRRRRKP